MTGELTKVYDLREDRDHVAAVQRATLTTRRFGLVPEYGLFGSRKWWRAIADGRLPVHTVDGVIARVFMSGHNDYPEIEVDDGFERTRWTRLTSGGELGGTEQNGKAALYQVGRRVQIHYVIQRPRQPTTGMPVSRSVIGIWIESSPSLAPRA